jgi:hypothetical protein
MLNSKRKRTAIIMWRRSKRIIVRRRETIAKELLNSRRSACRSPQNL